MSRFECGHSGNRNGRPKGSLNKSTQAMRELLVELTEANAGNVQAWLERVAESDPAKALDVWLRAVEFTTPKLGRLQLQPPEAGLMAMAVGSPERMSDEQLMRIVMMGQADAASHDTAEGRD